MIVPLQSQVGAKITLPLFYPDTPMFVALGLIMCLLIWAVLSGAFLSDEIITVLNYLSNYWRSLNKSDTSKYNSETKSNIKKKSKKERENSYSNYLDSLPLIECEMDLYASSNIKDQNTTASYELDESSEVKVERLHRLPPKRKSKMFHPKYKDVDYFKEATTRKIIDEVVVVGKKLHVSGKDQLDTIYLLKCSTKTTSFVTMKSFQSLQDLQRTVTRAYFSQVETENIPQFPLYCTTSNDNIGVLRPEQQINIFFRRLLSYQATRNSIELLSCLESTSF